MIDVTFWWPTIGLTFLLAGLFGAGVCIAFNDHDRAAAFLLAGFVMMCGWPVILSAGALIGAGYGVTKLVVWLANN